ncbi:MULTISPECIES: hypothetical protein [Burkholderia]|uniref:Uncharacterized protein n=1 Tax=Burkholderia pyrrocinia TaxID=60550 RepID=A0A318J1Y1_BURPY|nr:MULTISPECIES: hypothetical protein [Burkholderia]PXX41113.1 hypothetical protein NA66_1001723 [Burkholderia pyrrocinia]SFW58388.1 hypothetical protein SAMN03159384_03039 [Burkholderia sp. NFACC33-1]SFY11785.1 hypothetical protein SAMN03159408_03251 [Burkholderia sp. NFPP32]
MSKLTAYHISKIKSAIADCDRFIAKEEPRDASLRPADMQQHLDFCKAHKENLQNMLAAGVLV